MPAEPRGPVVPVWMATRKKCVLCLRRLPPLVFRDVGAHHLKGVTNAAPELPNVGGCLAERVLQTVQCSALLEAGGGCSAHRKCVHAHTSCPVRLEQSLNGKGVARGCCFGLPCVVAKLRVLRFGCEACPEGLRPECGHCMRWCRARLAFPSVVRGVARDCLYVVAILQKTRADCRAEAPCCVGRR